MSVPGREKPHKSRRPAFAGLLVDVVLKPSSVPPRGRPRCGGGHSSRAAVTGRLEQPTRGLGRVTLHDRLLRERPHVRLCGLAPDGVCLAASVTGGAVGSYPAVSPWPAARERLFPVVRTRQVVSSLLHFPSRSRDRALPGIVLSGARTFLPPRFWPFRALVHGRRSPVRHRRGAT